MTAVFLRGPAATGPPATTRRDDTTDTLRRGDTTYISNNDPSDTI
ncbi:hypothetical protein [Pseudarthrobacter sp. W1I19]|nr:hypothetical protein [Pseudarthrobacter sp. W1I19]